jgi:hypothetical protein
MSIIDDVGSIKARLQEIEREAPAPVQATHMLPGQVLHGAAQPPELPAEVPADVVDGIWGGF